MDALSKKRDAIVKDVETKYPYPSDFVMLRKKVKESWKEWVNQVPVVGFNSGKYDMNMIKEYFVKRVSFDEEKDGFAAKKDNGYMFITTSRFKFLDVKNYIGPGLSYDAGCRSMGFKLHKLVFPYEWLDSYEKLNFPCHNIVFQDFFSTRDGGCIMQRTKNALLKHQLFTKEYIQDRQCKTMDDVLRVYNLADVKPFAEALKKTAEQYYPDKIDMLKDAVSIPEISMTYVLNKALDNDKNLELYAPGGACNMCKKMKNQLDGCECNGALKIGAYCTDCQKALKSMNGCKCDPTETCNLLKTGMVGGPAQVFTRYHEKDVTYIRSNIEREKLCKKIIGYDANALYLYCPGDVMPCGKDKLTVIEKLYDKMQIQTFERNVLEDKFFGFAQVDIEVPHNLKDKFSEMPPLLVVDEITDNCIPEEMKLYKKLTGRKTIKGTKKLLGVTKAKKILLYSPLLKWYLNHGMVITGVHHLIGYEPGRPFAWFPEEVANARRQAENDPSKKQLGDVSKLKGNSFYGKMIEDLIRHLSTIFTSNERKVDETLRSPFFVDLEEIGSAYETKTRIRTVQIKRPYQFGIAVYQLAKLRMLEFYYDFLNKCIDRSDFELCYMDTDSFYLALSGNSLDDIVKALLKKEYLSDKTNWLATDKFSERTPGLFKPEFVGTRGVWLTAKCYLVQNEEEMYTNKENKYSCKGVSKKQNDMCFKRYKDVLDIFQNMSEEVDKAINKGFRVHEQGLVTYEQNKPGLSAYYDKRFVLPGGMHTRPLF